MTMFLHLKEQNTAYKFLRKELWDDTKDIMFNKIFVYEVAKLSRTARPSIVLTVLIA
jgi:hypothetical protein